MANETPLGRVVNVAPNGTMLIRSDQPLPVQLGGRGSGAVRIGMSAVDNRHETAGRIIDIIGPVAAPFVVVRPERGAKLHLLMGKELFGVPRAPYPSRAPRQGGAPYSQKKWTGGPQPPRESRGPRPDAPRAPRASAPDKPRPPAGKPTSEGKPSNPTFRPRGSRGFKGDRKGTGDGRR